MHLSIPSFADRRTGQAIPAVGLLRSFELDLIYGKGQAKVHVAETLELAQSTCAPLDTLLVEFGQPAEPPQIGRHPKRFKTALEIVDRATELAETESLDPVSAFAQAVLETALDHHKIQGSTLVQE